MTGLGSLESGGKASAKETKKVMDGLRQYFENESQTINKGLLSLPNGYNVQNLGLEQPAHVLRAVNDIVTSNICNLLQVPT